MKNPSISVIIPVFNEERTISHILQIVLDWGKAHEVIVVNDGSQDKTVQAVKQFGSQIRLITSKKNNGKGYAMSRGIEESNGDILMFIDGDVVGLTHHDLDVMLEPMVKNKADMVLGVARFSSVGPFEPFNMITGQRLVRRSDVIGLVENCRSIGYGVEVMLNEYYKKKRIVSVRLPFVFILGKLEKQKIPDAMVSYIKEAKDMLMQIIKDQTNSMKPHVRKILEAVINYLQEAIS